jgi:hypothetical protein
MMASEAEILRGFDLCDGHSDVDRAVLMLLWGYPERRLPELLALPIGARDSLLLALCERTFGDRVSGSALCPVCQQRSTFFLRASDLRLPPQQQELPLVLRHGDWELHYRLPTSYALRGAAACPDVESAADSIFRYCLLSARHKETPVSCTDLPIDICQRLGQALALADPQSEVLLSLRCAHCGHNWQSLFDIARFLWTELSHKAQRVFDEVHTLASKYGWSEQEILHMSPVRRRQYLQRCGHE